MLFTEICSRYVCGQYRARNWNWIGLYWNRFKLTKLLLSDINIPKWGFRIWNNGHSCHLCSTQYIFQRMNRNCLTSKKKLLLENIIAWLKSFYEIKATPFSAEHARAALRLAFLFLPLAKLRIFLAIISSRADKFLGVCQNFSMFICDGGCIFRMRVLYVRATLLRDLSRNIPS